MCLKMCYFFINILKIAMSLLYFLLISLYYSAIFVGGSARFGFAPGAGYPSYATDIMPIV